MYSGAVCGNVDPVSVSCTSGRLCEWDYCSHDGSDGNYLVHVYTSVPKDERRIKDIERALFMRAYLLCIEDRCLFIWEAARFGSSISSMYTEYHK